MINSAVSNKHTHYTHTYIHTPYLDQLTQTKKGNKKDSFSVAVQQSTWWQTRFCFVC